MDKTRIVCHDSHTGQNHCIRYSRHKWNTVTKVSQRTKKSIQFSNMNNELINWSQKCTLMREDPVTSFSYRGLNRLRSVQTENAVPQLQPLISLRESNFNPLEIDLVIQRSKYLSLSKTWMCDDSEHISNRSYQCVFRINNLTSSTTSAAGWLAIYTAKSHGNRLDINISDQSIYTRKFGYICRTEFPIATCVLESIYMHSGTTENTSMLMYLALFPCIPNRKYIPL